MATKPKKPEMKWDGQIRTLYVELDLKDHVIAEGHGYDVKTMDGKGRVYPEHPNSEAEAEAIVLRINTARGTTNATVARG